MPSRPAVLSLALAAFTLLACRRDAAEKRPAPGPTGETTLTSGQLDAKRDGGAAITPAPKRAPDEADELDDTRDQAIEARAASLVAFRNEQIRYRARVQAEIDRLEKLPGTEARRADLGKDLARIDRSTEEDWAPLRLELDRDLAHDVVMEPRR